MNTWIYVKLLFEIDDGSLPDIYVENLSYDQIVAVYEFKWFRNPVNLSTKE